MCSHLITRQDLNPTIQKDSTLGEYVETMDNAPLPVKNEELNIEENSDEVFNNEYIETTKNTLGTTNVKE